MSRVDYLKKYYIFNSVLIIWIAFIPLKDAFYQISVVLMPLMMIYHIKVFQNMHTVRLILKEQKSIFIVFGLIVLSMIISSILGINIWHSLLETLRFATRYMLILLVLLYFYKNDFFTTRFVIKVIVISLSIYALDGLYQYFVGYDLFKANPLMGGGLTGATFNRNVLGMFMAIGSIITFSLLFYNDCKNIYCKYGIFILFLLMIFDLLFSLSRDSWLFFTIYIILFVPYIYKKNLLTKKRLVMSLLVFLLVPLLFVSNDILMIRLHALLNGDSSSRFEIWREVLPYIRENILFGYGIDTYKTLLANGVAGVHNSILEILLFLGSLGLIIYLIFFRVIFLEVYKLKVYEYGFFLLSFLFELQFDGSLIRSKSHLSILVIALFFIYANNIKKREEAY